MALTQRYGIKYPFLTENNEGIFLDTNDNYKNCLISQFLHLVFTPKGQKLRDPKFGTELIDYVFEQKDAETYGNIKSEITSQVTKYIPEIEFRDLQVYRSETDDHGAIVSVEIKIKTEIINISIKI